MHAEKTSSAQQSSTDIGSPEGREELPASPSSTSRGDTASSPGNSSVTVEDDDEHTQEPHPRSRRRRPGAGSEADEETAPSENASGKDDVTAWLSLGKQAAESKCRELEGELAKARQELTKQDARFVSVRVVVHGQGEWLLGCF